MRSLDHFNKLVRPTIEVQPILAAGNEDIDDGDLFERDEPEEQANKEGEEQASRSHKSQIEERNDSDSQVVRDAALAFEEGEEDIGIEDVQEFVDADDVDNNQMLSMITETIAKTSEEVDIAEI